jgi:hypothetical protein
MHGARALFWRSAITVAIRRGFHRAVIAPADDRPNVERLHPSRVTQLEHSETPYEIVPLPNLRQHRLFRESNVRSLRTSARVCSGTRNHGCSGARGRRRLDALAGDRGLRRFCANADYDVCNWLTDAKGQERLCVACRHNDTIPDISQPSRLTPWRDIEFAKHRLFYSLFRWKLPLKTRAEDPSHGLAFEFLADPPQPSGPKVMTGHDDGVVTIALAEADSTEMEKRRAELAEPYRSLLGHFRHEVGHHYWDVLVRDGGRLEQCHAAFGDDSLAYEEALKRHYQHGPPADWPERFVSAYATSHPWEDFAETWAHYLHIVDTRNRERVRP